MKVLSTSLSSGWKWKQRENSLASSVLEELNLTDKWNAAQTFPSDIHVELIKAGKIPDPYVGFNEHKVQCKDSVTGTQS
jgi:beta-mannosidase